MDKKISQQEFDAVIDVLKRIGGLNREGDKSVINQMAVNAMKKANPKWNGYLPMIHDIDRAIQQKPEEFAKRISVATINQAIGNFHQLDKSIELINFLNRAKNMKKEAGGGAPAPAAGTTTMSSNVGLYPVPIGSWPVGNKKKKKHEALIDFSSRFARSFENFGEAKVANGYDISKIGSLIEVRIEPKNIQPPVKPDEFYREVEKLLAPLFKEKPAVKSEKESRIYSFGKGLGEAPSMSIQFFFDLKDFDGKDKSIWADHSSWLWVGILPAHDRYESPAFQFMIEYTDGSMGRNSHKWSVSANPFDPRAGKSKSIEDAWKELKQHLSELRADNLMGGDVKGPAFWND